MFNPEIVQVMDTSASATVIDTPPTSSVNLPGEPQVEFVGTPDMSNLHPKRRTMEVKVLLQLMAGPYQVRVNPLLLVPGLLLKMETVWRESLSKPQLPHHLVPMAEKKVYTQLHQEVQWQHQRL